MASSAILGKFHHVRQAQKEENDLLNDGITMFEQMKLLNASRGASMEALAEAHLAEVAELKRRHALELNAVNKRHQTEINATNTNARAYNSCPGLAPLFRDEILKVKQAFDDDLKEKEGLYREVQAYASRQDQLLREIHARAVREQFAWSTFLKYTSGELDVDNATLRIAVPNAIELCMKDGDLAQKYTLEGEKRVKEMEKAWATLNHNDKTTYRERLKKLLEIAAARGFQLGLILEQLCEEAKA